MRWGRGDFGGGAAGVGRHDLTSTVAACCRGQQAGEPRRRRAGHRLLPSRPPSRTSRLPLRAVLLHAALCCHPRAVPPLTARICLSNPLQPCTEHPATCQPPLLLPAQHASACPISVRSPSCQPCSSHVPCAVCPLRSPTARRTWAATTPSAPSNSGSCRRVRARGPRRLGCSCSRRVGSA